MASQDHQILKEKKNLASQNNSNRIRNYETDKSTITEQNDLVTQEHSTNNSHVNTKNKKKNLKIDHGNDYSNKYGKENEDIQTIKPLRSTTKNTVSTMKSSYKSDHTSLFTSRYNYNSTYSKLPLSLLKNKNKRQYSPFINNTINENSTNNSISNNNFILIQIDNLPPNKNWKQIKYLIGGIIHHSNVLQVKLLPPMTSLIAPFIIQQSCLVTLTNTLNDDMINDLILTLNSYTWDNYDLYSYIIPNPMSPINIPPILLNPPSSYSASASASSSSSSAATSPSASSAKQHELRRVKEQENEVNYPSSSSYGYLPFLYPMIPPTMYLPQRQYRKRQAHDFLKRPITSQKNSVDASLSPSLTSYPLNSDTNTVSVPSIHKNNAIDTKKTNEKQEQISFPSFVPIIPTSSPPSSLQQSGVMLLPQTTSVPPIHPITSMVPPISPVSFPPPLLPSQAASTSFSMKQPFYGKKFGDKVTTSPPLPNQSLYNSKSVTNTTKPVTAPTGTADATTTTTSPSTSGSPKSLAPNVKKMFSYPQHFISTYETNSEIIGGGGGFESCNPLYHPEQFNDMMGRTTDPNFLHPYMGQKRVANPFKQPKKLKIIFNERNFRKQMTERRMWQLKLENFPPYLLPETETSINFGTLGQNEIKIDIVTNMVSKYGKLRWTILKDFIKLKCPKLLNLRGQHNESISDTTREFYVGVYEAEEVKLVVDIRPEDKMEGERVDEGKRIVQMEAILYNAIIGFHNKEYFDICLKNLQDQEYSLGYRLHVIELPPYNEDGEKEGVGGEDGRSVHNGDIKDALEEEEIRQEISDLNLS